jgi:hypothetical protein
LLSADEFPAAIVSIIEVRAAPPDGLASVETRPPPRVAELPLTVQLWRAAPLLTRPPPYSAELPAIVRSVSVALAESSSPPPASLAVLPLIVQAVRLATVF